jgi:hypothetical protein
MGGHTCFLVVFANLGFVVAVEGTYLLPSWEHFRHWIVDAAFLCLTVGEGTHLAERASVGQLKMAAQ